jgi:hypothetical protein
MFRFVLDLQHESFQHLIQTTHDFLFCFALAMHVRLCVSRPVISGTAAVIVYCAVQVNGYQLD